MNVMFLIWSVRLEKYYQTIENND